MRKSYIMLAIVLCSISIHSCTTSELVEEIPIEHAGDEDLEILPEEDD